jgi:hypothetical protein
VSRSSIMELPCNSCLSRSRLVTQRTASNDYCSSHWPWSLYTIRGSSSTQHTLGDNEVFVSTRSSQMPVLLKGKQYRSPW